MTSSIRTFLLVNLLLSMTLVTSLAIIGNLFLEHRGFQSHLDSQLSLAAHTMGAFLNENDSPKSLKDIQGRMDKIPLSFNHRGTANLSEPADFNELLESIQFQVWNTQGKLILHSYAAPLDDINQDFSGFHNIWHEGKPWRTYAITLPESQLRVVVLQRHDSRLAIEKHITTDSMLIMFITYPFLGLMIWVVVGRGLEGIVRTAKALERRKPHALHPLRLNDLPTELMPLVNALNNLFERLEQAFNREKRFAADAAHELRTPLAALCTQTQVAMKASNLADVKSALGKVLTGVERSTHVVQQLLTLSRMVPDASLHDLETVDLRELATQIIVEVYPHADAKHTTVELEAPPELPTIEGNPHAIMILLRNLIDNAIRYSPENALINVRLEHHDQQLWLGVEDNGPGIPEAHRDRVFERFYRGLGTQATGSGLGLGIVKQIAQLHRAQIDLESPAQGPGVIIWVKFSLCLT